MPVQQSRAWHFSQWHKGRSRRVCMWEWCFWLWGPNWIDFVWFPDRQWLIFFSKAKIVRDSRNQLWNHYHIPLWCVWMHKWRYISDANCIAEIVSNTVSSALQSGDLVSSILRNPDLARIIDCLVTWGGVYSASSASVSTDGGPVVATDARFHPPSKFMWNYLQVLFSEKQVLTIEDDCNLSQRTGRITRVLAKAIGNAPPYQKLNLSEWL